MMKISALVLLLSALVTSVASAKTQKHIPPPGYEIVSVEQSNENGVMHQEIHERRIKVPPAPAEPEVEAPVISLPRKRVRTHVTTCDLCEAPDNIVFTHAGTCGEECADARVEHNREFHHPRRRVVQQEYCEPAPRRRSGFLLSIGGGRRVRRPQGRVVYNTAPRMVRRSGGRVYLAPTRPPGRFVSPPVFVGGRNGSNGSTVVGGSGRNGNSGSSFGTGQSGRFGSSGNPYGAR